MALVAVLLFLAAAWCSAHAVRRAAPVPATNPAGSSTLNGIAAPSDSFDSYCSHVPFPDVPKLPPHASGLTLAHLQVAIRHGARSSVRECPRVLGLDRLECSMAHTLSAPVLTDPDTAAPAGTTGAHANNAPLKAPRTTPRTGVADRVRRSMNPSTNRPNRRGGDTGWSPRMTRTCGGCGRGGRAAQTAARTSRLSYLL